LRRDDLVLVGVQDFQIKIIIQRFAQFGAIRFGIRAGFVQLLVKRAAFVLETGRHLVFALRANQCHQTRINVRQIHLDAPRLEHFGVLTAQVGYALIAPFFDDLPGESARVNRADRPQEFRIDFLRHARGCAKRADEQCHNGQGGPERRLSHKIIVGKNINIR
jgi:hypothetical protein